MARWREKVLASKHVAVPYFAGILSGSLPGRNTRINGCPKAWWEFRYLEALDGWS
jgi:hypothetical protein